MITLQPQLFQQRVHQLYDLRSNARAVKTDRLFASLFIFQWILGITFALLISPQTWIGDVSQTHIHVYAAIFLGGLVAAAPIFLVIKKPGAFLNRAVIAVSQILFSILFIHLTGGRIETHFHIFGSLAFLATYRDWRPLVIATAITAIDHFTRGALWPQSVYGVLAATPWRALEHAAWVVFEDAVLFYSIYIANKELSETCESQIYLEDKTQQLQRSNETVAFLNSTLADLNLSLEEKVVERTEQLEKSQQEVLQQQQTLIAASKMSALGEMSGGVAHEINNPLAIIAMKCHQLTRQANSEEIPRDSLLKNISEIKQTVERVSKIVLGLRTFARDASADNMEKTSINNIIESTLAFSQEKLKNHNIELSCEYSSESPMVLECRPTEISQILLNLLNNASDAIETKDPKWIKIEVDQSPEMITVSVTDCGDGISPEIRTKLMQPFFTTKKSGKGTGLGLSISLGIAKSHKGMLYIDSECKNTRFVLKLPKRQPQLSVEKKAA